MIADHIIKRNDVIYQAGQEVPDSDTRSDVDTEPQEGFDKLVDEFKGKGRGRPKKSK